MTSNVHRESAKIYQFPTRARVDPAEYREETAQASNVATLRLPKIVVESNWYHEEAVQESKRVTDAPERPVH